MATRKFLTHIDLNHNELQNAVVHKDSSLPASGMVAGQIFFKTGTGEKTLYQYDGTNWVRLVDTTYTATTDRAGLAERATDTEASTGTDTTRYITPAQMKSAIDAAVAGGMHFKGAVTATTAGGTTTTAFNPSGKSVGDQWIIIKDESDPQHVLDELTVQTGSGTTDNAKAGDTVICTNSSSNYWTIIPSGDEPDGTVTSITVTTPTGLKVNSGTSAEITTSGTFALTVDSNNGYEIPTTAHVKNYGKINTSGGTATSADTYNDTIVFAAAGGASVAISGDTVTYTTTDQKVKQTSSSDNAELPILLQTSASHTSGNTAEANYDADVKVNPSTGTLTATKFKGDGSELTNLPLSNYKTKQSAVSMPTAGSYTPGNEQVVLTSVTQDTNGEVTLASKKITIPATATATPSAIATSGAVGSSSKWAKEDHTHAISAGTIEGLLGVTTGANPITIAKKQVFSNPASTSTTLQGGEYTWTITHGLGTADVEVQIKTAAGVHVECEITSSASGTVVVKMNTSASSIAAGDYKAILIG